MAKILYIEDDKDLRDLTELVLARTHNHIVMPRIDTKQADAIVDLWSPDLVITDHELGCGKEKGLELALRLKKNGIKVAILSSSPDAYHGAAKAKIPFFYKPYDIRALL